MDERIIKRTELAAMLRVTSETMRRWLRDKKLPEPDVRIGRTTGWRPSTLRDAGVRVA